MKYYSYYPGCSAEGTGLGLGLSARAIAGPLGMELIELEGWNCCGSTPYGSLDAAESIVVAARNLALGEARGFDLVTPCSACCVTLNKTAERLKSDSALGRRVNEALSVAGLTYKGGLRVRHLVDVLANDITPPAIAGLVKRKLDGLKVAAYYGCQLVRPYAGDAESPRSLDDLVRATGAGPVDFPLKSRCCGGSLIISEEALALGLIRKLYENAASRGAEGIVTACPLCQTNLDAYQGKVNKKYNTGYNLPVLYITQLIGLALGLPEKELGLDTNVVSPGRLLSKVKQEV
ncbi:MAG: CoB--CoM heterodisulfide reductase iron-sulfur subunit B family protein [Chloroflexi bacterium]|nr:CoB--CoM heterodisulfide reductase iron-sulfur subunit B family protein [Chloroflexota bacterium]